MGLTIISRALLAKHLDIAHWQPVIHNERYRLVSTNIHLPDVGVLFC
jgi:hypothetical protein